MEEPYDKFSSDVEAELDLSSAIKSDNIDRVRYILKSRPRLVDGAGDDGFPLCLSIQHNKYEMVRVLIEEFKAQTNLGFQGALMYTFTTREMKKHLLKLGADINAYASTGEALIHRAIAQIRKGGDLDELRFLVDHGADVNLPQENGMQILSYFIPYSDTPPHVYPMLMKAVAYLIGKGTVIRPRDYRWYIMNDPVWQLIQAYDLKLTVLSSELPRIRARSHSLPLCRAVLRRVCDFI